MPRCPPCAIAAEATIPLWSLIQINSWASLTEVRIDSQTDLVIAVDVAKRLGISPAARERPRRLAQASRSRSASSADPRSGDGAASNAGLATPAGSLPLAQPTDAKSRVDTGAPFR